MGARAEKGPGKYISRLLSLMIYRADRETPSHELLLELRVVGGIAIVWRRLWNAETSICVAWVDLFERIPTLSIRCFAVRFAEVTCRLILGGPR